MEINIVYSANTKYCKLMAVAILSLFETNKHINNINVTCLLFSVDDFNKKKLYEIGKKYKRNINFIDIDYYCEKYRFWEKEEDSRYVRLLLPIILDNLDLVLYMDCDTMIRKDLTSLFKMDISTYYHASVLDTTRLNQRKESHIQDYNRYFNSGVMLINLKKWRLDNLIQKFKDFKRINNNKGTFRDQRVLNGTTAENYYILPPIYNSIPELFRFSRKQIINLAGIETFYNNEEIQRACKDPVIVHFAGRSIDRPWFTNCEHPFCNEYRQFMSLTNYTSFNLWHDTFTNIIKWKIKKHLPFILIKLFILLKQK